MITTKPSTIQVPEFYTCDKCQKTFHVETDSTEVQEFFSAEWRAGYDSLLEDGTDYSIDLCQHCFHGAFGKYIRKVNEEPKITPHALYLNLIEEWRASKTVQVPLIDYLKLLQEEYAAVLHRNEFPDDFLQRHGKE